MADPPRSAGARIADTRHRLEHDADAWLATASADGPWLVPLTQVWFDDQMWFATDGDGPTARNIAAERKVRVALGPTRDVVIIDGEAEIHSIDAVVEGTALAEVLAGYEERYSTDPRTWADVLVAVRPQRIQAWREENELKGRTIFRDGIWLDGTAG